MSALRHAVLTTLPSAASRATCAASDSAAAAHSGRPAAGEGSRFAAKAFTVPVQERVARGVV